MPSGSRMSTGSLRLVFAGTPPFAAVVLQALMDAMPGAVAGVFTQPDRPAGRGRRLLPSAVKSLALAHALPVFQPARLRDPADQRPLAALRPDLLIVAAYGLILPPSVLQIPRLGCVNVHASLLPRWRGAAPVERAIEAGDTRTGITIMQMDEGLDTGAVLHTLDCPILATDTGGSLLERLGILGARALLEALEQISGGTAHALAQDDARATYAAKLSREQAWLDWSLDASVLARRVRAFNPANVCHTRIGAEVLRVWMAEPVEHLAAGTVPGTVLAADRNGIRVACGSGALALTQLQLSGGKPMGAADLLNGRASLFAPGARLG
jgi:methionyl-tRNA formyltransferase